MNSNKKMEIGLKISQLRELKRLTRKEVAAMLDMSHRGYSAIENGTVSITLDRLYQISDCLNVDPIEILGFSAERALAQTVHLHNGNKGSNINHQENINELTLIEELIKSKDKMIMYLEKEVASLKFSKVD